MHNVAETSALELPVPWQDERCAFVGTTGSGKTELMKSFYAVKPNGHLIDTKLAKSYRNGGGVGEEVNGEQIYRHLGPGRKVWHTPDDFNIEYNPQAIERYFSEIYRIGNRVIAIDELLDLGTSSFTPFSVHRCYTRGREKGIGMWAGMQRPSGILPSARTEVEHKYCFYLEDPDDQDRMNAAFGLTRKGLSLPWDYMLSRPHTFFYRDPRGTVHGPFRLQLKGQNANGTLPQ